MTARKKSMIAGFKKITMDDIQTVHKNFLLSKFAFEGAKRMAEEESISLAKFVELAITSAVVDSDTWKKADKRHVAMMSERAYFKNLKKRITWKNKKSCQFQDSEVKEAFNEIQSLNLSGKELDHAIANKGLALTIEEIDG